MTERVILPREADADMLLAGQKSIEASVIGALRGESHIAEGAAYRAMLAASPNAGEVTRAEAWNAVNVYEREKSAGADPLEAFRAALSSLGIKVGG